MIDEVLEVLLDAEVVRVVGEVDRHRELRVLHHLPGGVDVERLVGGRLVVVVVVLPVAPDVGALLEALVIDAPLLQAAKSGDPRRTGADNADAGPVSARRTGTVDRNLFTDLDSWTFHAESVADN